MRSAHLKPLRHSVPHTSSQHEITIIDNGERETRRDGFDRVSQFPASLRALQQRSLIPRQRIDRYKADVAAALCSYIRHGLGQIRCHHPRTNRAASATKASRTAQGATFSSRLWTELNHGKWASRMHHQVSHLHFSSVECMHMNHEVNHLADPSIDRRASPLFSLSWASLRGRSPLWPAE